MVLGIGLLSSGLGSNSITRVWPLECEVVVQEVWCGSLF